MVPARLDSVEFTFFPIGMNDGEAIHRATFVGSLNLPIVTLFRSGGRKSTRIAFDVPRTVAEAKGYTDPSEVVRDAIGQALRDNLFSAPPDDVVYLDGDAHRWAGNLLTVR